MRKSEKITELDYRLLKDKYNEAELESILEKIEEDYPVQYAIGNVQFLDCEIDVDERVLIPRFATELLVDKLKGYIKKYDLQNSNMIDLCTGSGCIAIALKKTFSGSKMCALDKSLDALEVAKSNAKKNDVKVDFISLDILSHNVQGKFSVIVSNPPYVKKDEFVSSNTRYEPSIALYPGSDDIVFYKRIIDLSKTMLEDRGIIAFEIGSTQGARITEYAREVLPQCKVVLEKDYEDFTRFVFIFKNCE